MVLKDIAEMLKFLRKEGDSVYLWLSDDFPEDCREMLADFALSADLEKAAKHIAVIYDDKKIAEISTLGDRDKLLAISVSLKYMLYRLYDDLRKGLSEINENDVYSVAIQYVNEHLAEDISISDVAKHIHYSESYFGFAFKKKYNVSVAQYIREARLAKAKDLLSNTSFSIARVASCVGFDDPNYFSVLFKKAFGVSPTEYRKEYGRI